MKLELGVAVREQREPETLTSTQVPRATAWPAVTARVRVRGVLQSPRRCGCVYCRLSPPVTLHGQPRLLPPSPGILFCRTRHVCAAKHTVSACPNTEVKGVHCVRIRAATPTPLRSRPGLSPGSCLCSPRVAPREVHSRAGCQVAR